LNVVNTDADMPEAFSVVLVAIASLVVGIALSAVVMGQLDYALAIRPVVVVRDSLGRVCTQWKEMVRSVLCTLPE
jgi:hypothetical protein